MILRVCTASTTGTRRALVHALTAELALLRVDIGEVVFNGDCTERADLLAFAASDATRLAGLHHHGALVLRHARHVHRPGSSATSCAIR